MAENTQVDDFLAHYGVKGMKWGVKRSEASLARSAARGQKIDEARSREGSNNAAVSAARKDLRSARRDRNIDHNVGNMAKNGKEFAVGFLLGNNAMRSYAARQVSDPKKQSERANAIDAARSRDNANRRRVADAKSTLKELKTQRNTDKVVANGYKNGKEMAVGLLLGNTTMRSLAARG